MKTLPPHEVRDGEKLEKLAASMLTDGWIGRSILVVDCGDHYQALTGSHRIAAAEIAGIEPAVVVLYQPLVGDVDDDVAEAYAELWAADDDYELLSALEELRDAGEGVEEAVDLIAAEIAANEEEEE